MKTKSIIAMSLMAALAAGCSSDDIVDDGGKKPGTIEGKSYVSMNITLPTTNGTRAPLNDENDNEQFSGGDAEEYKVNEVKITFYEKSGETYIPIKKQVPIIYNSNELAWAASSAGVTTTALLPVRQVTFDENKAAFALVEVNPIDVIDNDDWAVNPTNNSSAKITVGRLTKKDNESAFFMTNTVWNDGHYLVPVKSFKSELEAQNHAKDYNIYVERAVAKATLEVAKNTENKNWGNTEETKYTYTINDENSVYNGATVQIAGWKLDVTNKKMYPIRKFKGDDATSGYDSQIYGRFYGVVLYGGYKRTYWAEDPNYDDYNPETEGNGKTENFKVISDASEVTNPVGSNEYCLENTFDTKHQKQDETTRVLVKAIYTPANITFENEEAHTWYTIGNSTQAYNIKTLQDKIKETLKTKSNVELSSDLAAGETTIETTTFKVDASNASNEQVATIKNALGSKITTYKNGECFYAIRIKHFGDETCPWGYPLYDNYLDGNKETTYLGRYGVVRNNWYQVTINNISQPGSPTIPELTTNQDDEQNYYLQANINILDWAVRKQGVEL